MSNMYDQGGGTDLRDQFRQEYTTQQNQMQQTKKSRRMWWIVGAVILVALLFVVGGSYNSLSNSREEVTVKRSDIDAQLQRRNDLIPNLVETARGYAQHESQVFTEIANARSRLIGAQTNEDKAAASDQLSGALGRLLVLQEQYPQLKANEQFTMLMKQLEGTENRIAVARGDYNRVVGDYNKSRQRFPKVVLANTFGFERAEPFEAAPGAAEAPKIDFGKKQ